MSILKIAKMGNPVLRQKARELELAQIQSPEMQRLISNMIETMREYEGVGLAAPQVHEPVEIAIIEVMEQQNLLLKKNIPLTVLINPVIEPISKDLVEGWEGCLSIPDIRGLVPRYLKIRVKGLDRWGKKLDFVAEDFYAVVIQHEIDHLNGILFIDRMKEFNSLTYLKEYAKYHIKNDDKG